MRERLASRLGFIFLSAGCAIGLGNVWRFPTVAGKFGGGWFVLLYLIFLALLALPILTMEFATGRAAQRSIATLHQTLTPTVRPWRLHGLAGFLGCTLLMMFYTTVTGWMLIYFWKTAAGDFTGVDATAVEVAFAHVLASPTDLISSMLVVSLVAAGVLAIGLQKGLERLTKLMMGGLLVLIVVLAIRSLTLEGAHAGVRFYLVPSLEKLRAVGVSRVVVEAMNQAFFTLSLGIGSMAVFGSYIGRERTLLGEALNVGALDTFVALVSGLVVLPACFACGLNPGHGPGLVFVTLPNVFNQLAGGRIWGSLFFLFLSFAALTTVLAVFENILACVREYTGLGRRTACAVLAVALPILSLPCVFGFNLWSSFQPFGPGSSVLDLEDFLVSNLLLPLGGLAFTLYCSHRLGWGWASFRAEANAGRGPRIPDSSLARIYCAFVLPSIIALVFVCGLLDKFKLLKFK